MPWLLAIPGVVALLAFHFVPIAFGSYYAFTDWSGVSHATWTGLANVRNIFRDDIARAALWHTLELAGCFVVIVNVVGLTLALGLNRAVKSRHLLRSVFFAPVALSSLAVAYIWHWIFTNGGALNRLLGDVGLSSLERPWLGEPSTAPWTILVVLVWQFSGLAMVLYLAGLQQISDELHEAALVDGASAWQRVRRLVLPLLAPAMTVSITLTFIIGMRVFDQIIGLTGAQPAVGTDTLATQIYQQTFVNGRFGYGAAFSLILTTLVAALALMQVALLRMNEQRL